MNAKQNSIRHKDVAGWVGVKSMYMMDCRMQKIVSRGMRHAGMGMSIETEKK